MRLAETYADAISVFRWDIPASYNIGVDVVDKHVAAGHGGELALVYKSESGAIERFSFADIAWQSNRLANLLVAYGIRPGDRVAILLPQRPETAISHVAIYKAGMVAVPLASKHDRGVGRSGSAQDARQILHHDRSHYGAPQRAASAH